MNAALYNRIKQLLEETNDAFESCAGCMNADYAAFASMRLPEFKILLEDPDLTGQELRHLLRRADQSKRLADPEGSWSAFLASYVASGANDLKAKNPRKPAN